MHAKAPNFIPNYGLSLIITLLLCTQLYMVTRFCGIVMTHHALLLAFTNHIKSFPWNFLRSDSTSEWAVVVNHIFPSHVHGCRKHFYTPLFDSVFAPKCKTESHHLSVTFSSVLPVLENSSCFNIVCFGHTIYYSDKCFWRSNGILREFTYSQGLSNWWASLKTFHDDYGVICNVGRCDVTHVNANGTLELLMNLLVCCWKPREWVYIAISWWYQTSSRGAHIVREVGNPKHEKITVSWWHKNCIELAVELNMWLSLRT